MDFRGSCAVGTQRVILGLACVIAAGSAARGFELFQIGGDATTGSIQTTVDDFRAALGDPNNANTPGPLTSGRREINWDGGGATTAAVGGPTLTGFQNTRGGTFATPGTAILQTPLSDAALTDLNDSYDTIFGTFSAQRIFTPVGSNVIDATFSIPGTAGATPATVSAFGAVFSDVDLPGSTTVQLYGPGDVLLTSYNVPAGTASDASLSFLGVAADNPGERIARVRITSGNTALGPNDVPAEQIDVVVMDDFFYAEPTAVPEPASSALTALSLIFVLMHAARRRD
jgi:hypothetical protein